MHTKLFLQFGLVFGHLPLLAIILGDEGVSATFKRQRKLAGESFWRTIAAFFDFLISKRNRLDRQSGDGQGYSCFFCLLVCMFSSLYFILLFCSTCELFSSKSDSHHCYYVKYIMYYNI